MISIVVPVYNAEKWLATCLDSLLNQTYPDIEIICIDDGSQDKSAFILADYAERDNRLKVIKQENKGIASARNRGILEIQGEWVMFVDADDWIDRFTCEKAMSIAAKHNVDIVLWPYMREFSNGKKVPRFLMDDNKLFGKEDIRSLHRLMVGPIGAELHDPTLLHSWGTVWGKLYSRNVILNTRFVDTKIVGSAEDVLFNIEVFTYVKRAFYFNETMYHYRKNEKSFTGGYNENLNERWNNLYLMMSDIIDKYNLPHNFRDALDNRIALGLIGQGLNECRSPRKTWAKKHIIKEMITQTQYRFAVKKLAIQYLPLHWRFFFWAGKNRQSGVLYILLLMINKRIAA